MLYAGHDGEKPLTKKIFAQLISKELLDTNTQLGAYDSSVDMMSDLGASYSGETYGDGGYDIEMTVWDHFSDYMASWELFKLSDEKKPKPSNKIIGLSWFPELRFPTSLSMGTMIGISAVTRRDMTLGEKGRDGGPREVVKSSKYSDREIEEWKALYERYGSFRRVHSHLKSVSSNDRAPSFSTIAKYVKVWFTIRKLDYDVWLEKYAKRVNKKWKYTTSDVKQWIKLYENIGSFWGVCDIIEKKTGSRPDFTSVKTRIREYFEECNKDFDTWAGKFKRTAKKYKESEVDRWISLYEDQGSFDSISSLLKQENDGKGPDRTTIAKRIKNYFDSRKLDYYAWVEEYYNPSYETVYSEADIKYWKILYERFGSFIDVSDYIKTKNLGFGPSRNVISSKLKESFENTNEDYDAWVNKYQKDNPSHFTETYTGEEVDNWESLFESIGTFTGVSEYIKEKNNGVGPYPEAIKRRLESKFIDEDRDFDLWIQQNYNPNTLRSHTVGNFMHTSLKYLSARPILKNDLDIFIEPRSSRKTRTRIDYVVMNNDKFDKYKTDKNKLFTIPENIHQMGFDFTASLKSSVIIDKCKRGYHGPNKMLVIVVMSDQNPDFRLPKNIPHLQNVKIINIFQYAELMGISVKDAQQIYSLTRRAYHEDSAYDKLESLANENNKKMIQLINKVKQAKGIAYNPFSDKAYKRYLQSNKLYHLLSQESKDSTLDDFMK